MAFLLFSKQTQTHLWANRVNLCLISAERSAGGDYRSACALLSVICDCLHWFLWHWLSGLDGNLKTSLISTYYFAFECWPRKSYSFKSTISNDTEGTLLWDLLRKYQNPHTRPLTNTDFSLYFVSSSSGALKHWSISPQVSCERHTVV